MSFKEHPDVERLKHIIERQEAGCECPDCARNLGHLHHCAALKAYLAARGKTLTAEDRDRLFEDLAVVTLTLNTKVSAATKKFCKDELRQAEKRGWKWLRDEPGQNKT